MTEKLKIFLWAAMHSPNFKFCYIPLPLSLHFKRHYPYPGYVCELHMEPLNIYLPWMVRNDYYHFNSEGITPQYEEIPF